MTERYNPRTSPYHPLMNLAFLRYGVKDEIPARIVRGNKVDDKPYKVRGNWWHGLHGDLEAAIRKKMVADAQLVMDIEEFCAWIKSLQFNPEDTPDFLRTADDIRRANDFIDRVLSATGYADTPLDLSDFDR